MRGWAEFNPMLLVASMRQARPEHREEGPQCGLWEAWGPRPPLAFPGLHGLSPRTQWGQKPTCPAWLPTWAGLSGKPLLDTPGGAQHARGAQCQVAGPWPDCKAQPPPLRALGPRVVLSQAAPQTLAEAAWTQWLSRGDHAMAQAEPLGAVLTPEPVCVGGWLSQEPARTELG